MQTPTGAERISQAEVKSPRVVRVLGGDARIAANDEPGELTPEDVEEEVRRIEQRKVEADLHYNELKNSGVLEQRRVAFAHRFDDPWKQ